MTDYDSSKGMRPVATINGKQVTEPFAWMSNTNRQGHVGRYKIQLDTPRSEAVFGSFLIIGGLFLAVIALQTVSTATILLAIILFVIFGGIGIILIIMAILRRRWFKAYFSEKH